MSSSNNPTRIVVLSAYNLENFGDRLGYYNINSIAPENCEITYASFIPWDVPQVSEIDILILGIGNSIFELLLGEHIIRLVEAVPCSIGIFGTQYRNKLNKTRFRRLVSALDVWYARNEEDLEWFGSFNSNSHHLGDWLINLFPMARPTVQDELNITKYMAGLSSKVNPLEHAPLDRIIQTVQRFQFVSSPKLHLLLCALTSAKKVAFSEQRDFGFNEVSGKFNSLLNDVFGRHYPENEFFEVDRDKVIEYKVKVRKNMEAIKLKLAELCKR